MEVTKNSVSLFDKVKSIDSIPIDDILKAQRIAIKEILNTPLVKLNHDVPGKEIYLKLENLQPVGSFKVRGAYNAVKNLDHSKCQSVATASAGNFAQGLAWVSKKEGIKCTAYCPDTVPKIKEDRIKEFGAEISKVTYDEWWNIMTKGELDEERPSTSNENARFIHACCEYDAIAGNGVIGLEIAEQLEDFDAVVCPWGGGSNLLGTASALKHVRPNVKAYACEVDVAAPLHASLKAGKPSFVKDWKSTFVDGMNGKSFFPCMWNMAKNLVLNSVLVDVEAICHATRLLTSKNKLIAEGAGAATVAAALSDDIPPGKIVCVISGGNIDMNSFVKILNHEIP